jgi:glycosyltransferase involved in cell wall biosynthesis
MEPLRIGVIFSRDTTNVNYRALAPLMELEKRGHSVVQAVIEDGVHFDPEPLMSCDVVHIYRRGDAFVARCVDALRARGIGVVWDDDDDARAMPQEASGGGFDRLGGLRAQEHYHRQVRMMRRVNIVTLASAGLARQFEGVDANIKVVENFLSPIQLNRDDRRHSGVVIGWVAAGEHRADAQRLRLAQTLRNVMEVNRHVIVVTIGVRLNLDESTDRYLHIPRVPFEELASYIRKFDIGIAPLADIPMSYVRSNVKVKEYAGAGVPWVASARGPYAGLEASRCGGVTVSDDEWFDTLVELAGSRLRRARMHRRAEAWGESQCIDRNVDQWENVWRAAIADARQPAVAV